MIHSLREDILNVSNDSYSLIKFALIDRIWKTFRQNRRKKICRNLKIVPCLLKTKIDNKKNSTRRQTTKTYISFFFFSIHSFRRPFDYELYLQKTKIIFLARIFENSLDLWGLEVTYWHYMRDDRMENIKTNADVWFWRYQLICLV